MAEQCFWGGADSDEFMETHEQRSVGGAGKGFKLMALRKVALRSAQLSVVMETLIGLSSQQLSEPHVLDGVCLSTC